MGMLRSFFLLRGAVRGYERGSEQRDSYGDRDDEAHVEERASMRFVPSKAVLCPLGETCAEARDSVAYRQIPSAVGDTTSSRLRLFYFRSSYSPLARKPLGESHAPPYGFFASLLRETVKQGVHPCNRTSPQPTHYLSDVIATTCSCRGVRSFRISATSNNSSRYRSSS